MDYLSGSKAYRKDSPNIAPRIVLNISCPCGEEEIREQYHRNDQEEHTQGDGVAPIFAIMTDCHDGDAKQKRKEASKRIQQDQVSSNRHDDWQVMHAGDALNDCIHRMIG